MKLWLNVGDAAEYVRRATIYTACERREIRHVRSIGGRRSVRLSAWIDDWYERGARAAIRPVPDDVRA